MPPGAEYQFKFQLPQSSVLPQMPKLDGALGGALKAFVALAKPMRVEWFIEGTLDVPNSVDIGKKVKISVS